MTTQPRILIVDDKIENLIVLERTLSDLDVDFVRATSGNEALKKTLDTDFAIALIDVQMPEMDGFETVALMRQDKRTRHLPVIFISAIYKENYHQIKGIQTGAVDFITKPIVPEILEGKVRIFLELHSNKIAMQQEISRRKQSEEALRTSQHDLETLNRELQHNVSELKASEERFKSLVITIPDIVYRIDKDGTFTFVNDAVSKLGYDPSELVGRHFSSIILPAEVPELQRSTVLPRYRGKHTGPEGSPKLFDERRTGKRKTTGLEVRLISKNRMTTPGMVHTLSEETVVAEVNSAGMYGISAENRETVFLGTVGVIRDISDRKRAEQEILRQRALLDGINRMLLETLRCETDREVAATCLNVAEDLTGSSFGFVNEAGPDGFVSLAVSDPGWRACSIPEAKKQLGTQVMEIRGLRGRVVRGGKTVISASPRDEREWVEPPDGHPHVTSFMGVPLKRGNETFGMIGLGNKEGGYKDNDRHVVEALSVAFIEAFFRKRAEKQVREARDSLEKKVAKRTAELQSANRGLKQLYDELKNTQSQVVQAEKMAATGTLVAGVAHELNNPLMGMLNFAQYCLKHTGEDDRRYKVLQSLERETLRCTDIVQNLLSFSRWESTDDDYLPGDLAAVVDRVLKLLAYRIEKEGITIKLSVDDPLPRMKMQSSALQQVFLNLITNALDALKESSKKEIVIAIAHDHDTITAVVRDTGSGISSDVRGKMFDPFFTTKPVGKGTGLGLSVTRGIVVRHGGEISCSGSREEGTEFTIAFPMR